MKQNNRRIKGILRKGGRGKDPKMVKRKEMQKGVKDFGSEGV